MTDMTREGVWERMRRPSEMTPREVMESYMFMSSLFAERFTLLSDALAQLAVIEGEYIKEGMSAAAAKVAANATEGGQLILKLKGEVRSIEETIKALKKAQAFYSDEARNLI